MLPFSLLVEIPIASDKASNIVAAVFANPTLVYILINIYAQLPLVMFTLGAAKQVLFTRLLIGSEYVFKNCCFVGA